MSLKKKLIFVSIVALSLFSTNNFAIEEWNGVKTFAQIDFDKIIPLVFEMKAKHKTISVADDALNKAGHGTYLIEDDKMTITLTEPIKTIRQVPAFNPYTNRNDFVDSETTLSSVVVLENADQTFDITMTGKSCFNFYNDLGEIKVDCQNLTRDYERTPFTVLRARRPQTNFKAGDKVALPVMGIDSAFVEINLNNKATNLSDYTAPGKITALEKRQDAIYAELDNGYTINYTRLGMRNGSELLMGIVRDSTGILDSLAAGTIVVAETVNTRALTFGGEYNVAGFGGLYTSGDEFIIQFLSDGFGGFNSYDITTDSSWESLWSWEETKEGMKASRWMSKDDYGLQILNTKEEIQACLNQEQECIEFQKREYSLLSKDGNKYVMLRRMETNYDTETTPSVHYSINYLYKK